MIHCDVPYGCILFGVQFKPMYLRENEKEAFFWQEFRFNPILTGLLYTHQKKGGVFYPPPNSLVFYPRGIKFGR